MIKLNSISLSNDEWWHALSPISRTSHRSRHTYFFCRLFSQNIKLRMCIQVHPMGDPFVETRVHRSNLQYNCKLASPYVMWYLIFSLKSITQNMLKWCYYEFPLWYGYTLLRLGILSHMLCSIEECYFLNVGLFCVAFLSCYT